MDHYKWNSIPEEKMNSLLTRQVIHTGGLTVARLRIAKGAVVPMHQHHNEQLTMMDKGTLRFEISGKEIVVRAGEMLLIPPDAPHMVEALEDSIATDIFTPRREDWIRGDDAYLRK
jgi:quercetin dioxygenase-like cupin family protein